MGSLIFKEISVLGQYSLTGLQTFKKRTISWMFSLVYVLQRVQSANSSLKGILHIFALTNNLKDEISQNFSFFKSRAIILKEKQGKITLSHISFNLKPCSISKRIEGCSSVTLNDCLPRIPPLWREAPCNLQILTVIYFFSDYHWTINPFDYFCFKVINIQIAQCWLLKKN